MKKILFLLIFTTTIFANELFLLPDEANSLKNRLRYEILNAKETIFVAMYNFSYKQIAKHLIEASKNGVKITVLLDKSKVENNDTIYSMLKEANINVIFDDKVEKMHLKAMLIDDKLAVLGSMNFTRKSFEENYDFVYFNKDKKIIQKLKKFKQKFD